ncbi:MAG: FtsX-like permease family protein [Alphaproteobacteria bacterium]|nr:FtsX-like permease family protein [Alphaproteobacteria bacterium]
MSLALSTLIYEWRRYLAAVISLALASVLMLALSAFFVGVLQSFTATIDKSRAQLIVMAPDAKSLVGRVPSLPKRILPLVYRHPEVEEVQDLTQDFGPFYGPGATAPTMVNVMVVETSPNAITLPDDFTDSMRKVIETPYNIAVDKSALAQLGVKLGDQATLNGKTVRVALILTGYANSQAPGVVMSRQTQRLMGRANDDQLGLLMVRIKDPSRAVQVRDELNAMGKDQFRVWLKKELSAATIRDAMKQGPIAIMMLFLTAIGFVIGVVITWQTLRGAILANIKEFASLRALGVSMAALRGVIIELSIYVGVIGVVASTVLMFGLTMLASAYNVAMSYQLGAVVQTAVLLLMISIGSGLLTLGALNKGDPADLLK